MGGTICPLLSCADKPRTCVCELCKWWTTWDEEGMCAMNRLVQFANKKDVSKKAADALRKKMKEYGW